MNGSLVLARFLTHSEFRQGSKRVIVLLLFLAIHRFPYEPKQITTHRELAFRSVVKASESCADGYGFDSHRRIVKTEYMKDVIHRGLK